MKFYKLFLIILIVFSQTGNVLSNSNIFDVNNIEIEKKGKISNEALANKAITMSFKQLIEKILLKKDVEKLKELKFTEIKELVRYYQVSNKINHNNVEKINYNISFDKDKIHDLFYKKNISYSEITNKELFILPILRKKDQVYIYNQNFFYDKWNEFNDDDLIEFILPLENIEIIQYVNSYKNDLLNLDLRELFQEYSGKNLALVLIEDNSSKEEKIYFKTKIQGKNIFRNVNIKRFDLSENEFYKKIITEVKIEIISLVKSQNLIDVRTPSFLNVKLKINKKNNLAILNSRLQRMDLIDNIYVQKFNNENIYLKIKYLGKLDKIIRQLENQKILLKLINNEWNIEII
jgi:hypothetical protein